MTDQTNQTRMTVRGAYVLPAPLIAGLAAFAMAAAIALVGRSVNVPLDHLIRDPAAQFNYPAHGGLISHLGVLLLAATAAIAAFGAALAQSHAAFRLLLGAAILSAVLTLDDLFMLHENLDGAWQGLVFAAYGLAVLGLAAYAKRRVSGQDLTGLLVVLAFLGLSAFIDMTGWRGSVKSALEDFSKLAGYAAWLTFWVAVARTAIVALPRL